MDMEQKTGTNNNLFVGTLTHYIMSHHPDRMEDMDFINERAEQAAKDFEVASRSSLTVDEAMEVAYKTLFRGLVFSPFLTVKEVVLDLMDYTEEDEELDEFVLQMLELTRPAFEKWDLDDKFQGTPEYLELCDEIKLIINQYLITNGIQ